MSSPTQTFLLNLIFIFIVRDNEQSTILISSVWQSGGERWQHPAVVLAPLSLSKDILPLNIKFDSMNVILPCLAYLHNMYLLCGLTEGVE